MAASAAGRLVLFVPPGMAYPMRIERVLVPHDGTPTTSAALDSVENLTGGTQAEIVVLHVIGTELPVERGTLQAPRMVDHDGDDWHDWREEFGRRFSHRSTDFFMRLEISVGPRSEMILRAAHRLPADLVVMGWGGIVKAGRAWTLRSVCGAAPCPVLLVAAARPRLSPHVVEGSLLGYHG
jgi:nucleotide-binding universal stress UspA family protein